MNNSIILKCIYNLLEGIKKYYKNSSLHAFFCKVDGFFANAGLNSAFTKIFTTPLSCKALENCTLYKLYDRLEIKFRNSNEAIVKWIINSTFFDVMMSLMVKLEKCPFKIIGIFGVSFMLSNIVFQLYLHRLNYTLIIKVILLIGFFVLSQVKISFRRAIRDSFFIKLAAKILQ